MTGEGRFELERAITQNELELHYQPIFDINGDALRGVEALVRWKHPQIASRGIAITLDDVTSVTQLDGATDWPLDTVKIGREIIGHALDDPRASDMARAIASFAVQRGIGLIAVGIESKAMLGLARALGCIGAQGYLLARPMASQELRRWARASA